VATASASVTSVRSETEAALDVLITRIMAKRDNPFAPAATAPLLASMPPLLAEAVTALNSVVDKHNRTSWEFRASVDQACKELEASYVGEAHAEFVQFSEVVTNASTALEDIKTKPADIQSRIDELERAILEHRRPGDELTKELHAYLGRDELRFEVRGSGYALTRDGQPVSHLSEGERTAIAFLYFLKSLQDKAFDMSKGIVVIDDPVSSLDANSLFSAFGYMKERTKECGQLFILTHNFQFFRNVKNWFHYIIRHSKRLKLGPEPAQFYLLREFIVKGFVLDDERLKLNKRFGKDYFDELLERIREIRASERRFYLKITDIYEQCSIDYDKQAETTQTFFKTVQNKLHWAVTGKTAAELIAERADAEKPSMGLTTWKNAPKGKILKSDVASPRTT
jgi:energy-coupling factor transporter ATP-binding protein EcfA2